MSAIKIFFMFAVVIASTVAGVIDQSFDNNAVFVGNPNVPVDFNENAEERDFELPVATLCCTLGRCIDACWAYGFRPTFSAQCISCSTCRCVQY